MLDTIYDIEDKKIELFSQAEDLSCKLIKMSKEPQTNIEQCVYVDADGNDAVAYVYDTKFHTWKSTDTMDKLAVTYCGDASFGTLLSYYNGVKDEHSIKAGEQIKIPVFVQNENIFLNKVFLPPEQKENYGRDIALDDEGNFSTLGNDFLFTTGKANLSQAVGNRLSTAFKKRIRLTSYGIRAGIGEAEAVSSYVSASVEQTVLADPRVEKVTNLAFNGFGDGMKIHVDYVDINGQDNATEVNV